MNPPPWMMRQKRRELARGVVTGLLVVAVLLWGIYS